MTYDQLEAFLAVAEEGGFTAASGRLHKSQPAVSKLVRNLEEELGLALFDRREYRATLSDAGRLFYERAAAVVADADALKGFARALAGVVEPIVRLAVDAVAPLGPILAVLRDAQERHPGVRFELRTERLAGVRDALAERRADLGIGTPFGLDRERLESAPWTSVRVIPVARADHPLARCGVPIPSALLREHAQIVLRDSALADDGPSLNVLAGGLRWSVTDVASKRDIIAAGMGWGGLPEHVVAEALSRGELVALAVPQFEIEEMELVVMRRRAGARGVVAQRLWEELRAAAARAARQPEPPARPSRRSARVEP